MEAPKATHQKRPVLSRATAPHPPVLPQLPTTISKESTESTEPIMANPVRKDDENIETINDTAEEEEAGKIRKVTSAGEDPFGNEEGAGIKYKTMTWW